MAVALLFMASPSLAQQPNPQDFAVPAAAFTDFEIIQFGGGLGVRSKSFSSWLKRTGKFGELVSLSDKREFGEFGQSARLRPKDATIADQPDSKLKEHLGSDFDIASLAIPENRVCDIAYQLIYEDYGVKPLSYRYDLEKRNRLIAELVLKIHLPVVENAEKTLDPTPKEGK